MQPLYTIGFHKTPPANPAEVLFYHQAVLRAIDAYLAREYTAFDAHTTTTCCHGVAAYACDIIEQIHSLDITTLRSTLTPTSLIPSPLIELTRLYICSFVKKDQLYRRVTEEKNLRQIYPISTRLSLAITTKIQQYFSNLIAARYSEISKTVPENFKINGIKTSLWRKYISPKHLRRDTKDTLYASALYSMQVLLAHLNHTKKNIAIHCRFLDQNGNINGEYTRLLQGDGEGRFIPLTSDDLFDAADNNQTIIVFSGHAQLTDASMHTHITQLREWEQNFATLILACDMFYPQFPRMAGELNFNSHPILPDELELRKVMNSAATINGTSADNPSLYCLSHIYPAGAEQLAKGLLPSCPIPQSQFLTAASI